MGDVGGMTGKATLEHRRGDATKPEGNGPTVICHICNDCVPGRWGAGFVLALSHRWKYPERVYREWSSGAAWKMGDTVIPYGLGEVQFVQVEDSMWVANMVAQHGTGRSPAGAPPVRYDAIVECLDRVYHFASDKGCRVVCPRMGSGLAGGDWATIEAIIMERLVDKGIPVVVYNL